jgi:hypothetical protein
MQTGWWHLGGTIVSLVEDWLAAAAAAYRIHHLQAFLPGLMHESLI